MHKAKQRRDCGICLLARTSREEIQDHSANRGKSNAKEELVCCCTHSQRSKSELLMPIMINRRKEMMNLQRMTKRHRSHKHQDQS